MSSVHRSTFCFYYIRSGGSTSLGHEYFLHRRNDSFLTFYCGHRYFARRHSQNSLTTSRPFRLVTKHGSDPRKRALSMRRHGQCVDCGPTSLGHEYFLPRRAKSFSTPARSRMCSCGARSAFRILDTSASGTRLGPPKNMTGGNFLAGPQGFEP